MNYVIAQIINSKMGEGEPFVTCEGHYEETRQSLAEKAPHCFLTIIAHNPTNPVCGNCEWEKEDT